LRSESRSHAHHHQQTKKQHEPIKIHHSKGLPSEAKSASMTNTSKENTIAPLRAATAHADVITPSPMLIHMQKEMSFFSHLRVRKNNNHHHQ
jgi:hypothetical protein